MKHKNFSLKRIIILLLTLVIFITISITSYTKLNAYPISKADEKRVEEIHSYLLTVKTDLNLLKKNLPKGTEKSSNLAMKYSEKTDNDIENLSTLLQNFKFKTLPDKGLILWKDCAAESKDAYLFVFDQYNSKVWHRDMTKDEYQSYNSFIKDQTRDINENIALIRTKDVKAYNYFQSNHYFIGLFK